MAIGKHLAQCNLDKLQLKYLVGHGFYLVRPQPFALDNFEVLQANKRLKMCSFEPKKSLLCMHTVQYA